MAKKSNFSISINMIDRAFEFYYMPGGKRVVRQSIPYKSKGLDDDFYASLTEALNGFLSGNNIATPVTANLVLPSNLVFSDTIRVINMGRKTAKSTFQTAMTGLYKNMRDLRMATNLCLQNKHVRVYSVWGARRGLLESIGTACTAAKCTIKNVVFASSSTAAAAAQFNSKLKNATYMLLDIKQGHTDIIYIYKGRATGAGTLPFGVEIIRKTAVEPEDMLFNHPLAELTVLNAKEKARMKTLTMMEDDAASLVQQAADENAPADDEFVTATDNNGLSPLGTNEMLIKTLPKKTPRKLPQYMQRPAPEDETQVHFENFRVFTKWVLCYIQGNDQIRQLAQPDAVYVNMPKDLDYILEDVNSELRENGIEFKPLGASTDDEDIRGYFDLYGVTALDKPNNMIELSQAEPARSRKKKKSSSKFSLFGKKKKRAVDEEEVDEDITSARADLFVEEKKRKKK